MTNEERNRIGHLWVGLAQMYGKDIAPAALAVMLKAIDDIPALAIEKALNDWVRTSKLGRYPFPADIRDLAMPAADPRVLAIATVGRIKEAIDMFGWPQPSKARAFIGDTGWRYVERCGGWQAVCEKPELNIHEPNVTAQMRDSIEADIKLKRAGFDMDKPLIEQSKSQGLESASDILKRIAPKKEE